MVPPSFATAVDLDSYHFPDDAEVVVEAGVDWTLMRFPLGTVAHPTEPMQGSLTELEVPEGVRFSVKVLGTGDAAGLILGEASNIVPSEPEIELAARSFIDVRPEALGHVAWQLTFDETHPILKINSAVGDWKGFVRAPAFRSLAIPEIFRRMLEEAAESDLDIDGEAPIRDWEAQCLTLGARYSNQSFPVPQEPDRRGEWIDAAVLAFARHARLGDALRAIVNDDGGE